MSELLKKQKFGVEVEFTGITRTMAAEAVAEILGSHATGPDRTCYRTYTIRDSKRRIWKVMRDSSICPVRKAGRELMDEYRVEFVTPPLNYEWPYLCAKVYVSIKWIDENKTTYTRIFPSAVGFMSYKTKGSMEDDLKQKENMSTMEMREHLKISRAEFSRRYNIPVRTLENWESGKSKCPDYVRQLLERAVLEDCEVK